MRAASTREQEFHLNASRVASCPTRDLVLTSQRALPRSRYAIYVNVVLARQFFLEIQMIIQSRAGGGTLAHNAEAFIQRIQNADYQKCYKET